MKRQNTTPEGGARVVVTPALGLILTAMLWSTSGLLVKMLDWQPLSIWAGRGAIAFVVLLIYLRRFSLKRLSLREFVAVASFVAMQLTFIMSNKLTTAANAIFLQYTAPVYVVLLAVLFLNERPERADWVTMIVIFVGLLFFFGDELSYTASGARSGRAGDLLALLSGVALAGMNVAMRAKGERDPAELLMLGHLFAAVAGAPSLLQERITLANVGIIAFLGIFQIGLASILYAVAIRHVPALESTLILTLEPVLNPIWVFLVLGEAPGLRALIGGLLVIGAVVWRALAGARVNKRTTLERSNV